MHKDHKPHLDPMPPTRAGFPALNFCLDAKNGTKYNGPRKHHLRVRILYSKTFSASTNYWCIHRSIMQHARRASFLLCLGCLSSLVSFVIGLFVRLSQFWHQQQLACAARSLGLLLFTYSGGKDRIYRHIVNASKELDRLNV